MDKYWKIPFLFTHFIRCKKNYSFDNCWCSAFGSTDLAFQIIHREERFADSITTLGESPLHILAQKPTTFRSGIDLSFFKNIIYHCKALCQPKLIYPYDNRSQNLINSLLITYLLGIHVEELVPDTFKEKKELIAPSSYPTNYQTCFEYCQLHWKMMKSAGRGDWSTNHLFIRKFFYFL